jgi:hypothetical protein
VNVTEVEADGDGSMLVAVAAAAGVVGFMDWGFSALFFWGVFRSFFSLVLGGRKQEQGLVGGGDEECNICPLLVYCRARCIYIHLHPFSVHFYYIQYSSRSTVLILVNPTFKSFGYLSIKYILFIFKLLLSMIF